jgi:hypothetical protein
MSIRMKPFWQALAAALWLLAVVSALAALGVQANRAGSPGAPPARWPAESALAPAPDRPTLVLFAHPRCPCTRATLGELDLLLAQSGGRLRTHVLFIQPPGTPDDWVQTDLWHTASQLSGVTVHRDRDGVEARRFHCETSGQVLLYDRGGRLAFQGGITISRGHAGDNPGRNALLTLLDPSSLGTVKTPVFGCPQLVAKPVPPSSSCKL